MTDDDACQGKFCFTMYDSADCTRMGCLAKEECALWPAVAVDVIATLVSLESYHHHSY